MNYDPTLPPVSLQDLLAALPEAPGEGTYQLLIDAEGNLYRYQGSLTPQQLAALGERRMVRGEEDANGNPDADTLAAIKLLTDAGWPEWAIWWEVTGTSSDILPLVPASLYLGSTFDTALLSGILAPADAVMGLSGSEGTLIDAEILAADPFLIAGTLEEGALIGNLTGDGAEILCTFTEATLSELDTLVPESALLDSALSEGELTGLVAADSALLAATADSATLTGLLASSEALVNSELSASSLTGVLLGDSGSTASALSTGGLTGNLVAEQALVALSAGQGELTAGAITAAGFMVSASATSGTLTGVLAAGSATVSSSISGGVLSVPAVMIVANFDSGTFDGWTFGDAAEMLLVNNAAIAYSGSYCVGGTAIGWWDDDAEEGGPPGLAFEKTFPSDLKAGTFSFRYKVTAKTASQVTLDMLLYGVDANGLGVVPGNMATNIHLLANGDWQEYSQEVVTPTAGLRRIFCSISTDDAPNTGSLTIYIDNISVPG